MHLHILGICGTFMGGIAAIAAALGHKVTGSDTNVYPPMSTQLQSLGIELSTLEDLSQFADTPDKIIIGNALSRGHPAVEYVLDNNMPYTSGPQWLKENVLQERWVLAVSGTHGKTTTTSMLAWILEHAGMEPGFLIGGVAQNFNQSARLGNSMFFVIEADEYDSAFFDKRAKCVHYLPRTFIINNLEFDHADIYADLAAIQTQLHHAVRTVPSHGCVISSADDEPVQQVLKKGCWSEQMQLHREWEVATHNEDYSEFSLSLKNKVVAHVKWSLFGEHNMHNAAMAIAATHKVGVAPEIAADALTSFVNVKRRMEKRGAVKGITIFDDFAHHPTAINTTLSGLKKHQKAGRILAIIELRSNTMKKGVHQKTLASSWADADYVWIKADPSMRWINDTVNNSSPTPVEALNDTDLIIEKAIGIAQPGDTIVVMSNGGFDNIHQKLLEAL